MGLAMFTAELAFMKEWSMPWWKSPGPGFGVSGLVEGKVGGGRDTMGLLVVFEQLFQSLHVELVIMVHVVFGGCEALGHMDRAAHCREGRPDEKALLLQMELTGTPFPRDLHSPTVVIGWANGTRPQDSAEKRLRPQKMQGENPISLLKATWHRYCQEFWSKDLVL